MTIHPGRRLAGVVVATMTIAAGLAAGTNATAEPSVVGSALVITVTQAHGQMIVSPDESVPAGWTTFNYSGNEHTHLLQAASLHPGYSPAQLRKDLAAAHKGRVKAIRRLDTKVTWLGGAESKDGQLGRFTADLPAGTIYLFDRTSNSHAELTVTRPRGSGEHRYAPKTVRATKTLGWHSPATLPKGGWINLRNPSGQPHDLSIQRVRSATTAATVRSYIKRGAQGTPPWGRGPKTTSGLFSAGTHTQLHLRLPAGKYLIASNWRSKKNGKRQILLGMWKLVILK